MLQKMKISLFIILCAVILSCSADVDSYDQVSHFQTEDFQYYTFNIDDDIDISKGLSEELLQEIKAHGSQLMLPEEDNIVIASFYYKKTAPDLSGARDEVDASTIAKDAKPLAVVWAMPDGRIRLIRNPG